MKKYRVGILGYGNLGRGVELAVDNAPDMELSAVFTRRAGLVTDAGRNCVSVDDMAKYADKIDVLILCGGSATDLPVQGVEAVKYFNTVDSFDTHARIPEYFGNMDKAAKSFGHLCVISVGWDPGLFSMARLIFEAILPKGENYTFWGKGVSQGHSDAIRRIEGVKNAIQYTIPIESALEAVRGSRGEGLTARDKHMRECYVVAEEGADKERIEREIVSMPNYFADYNTVVHFISDDEMKANHRAMPHGGTVIRSGETKDSVNNVLELNIKLDSNPLFTSSVLTAYARAIAAMAKTGMTGALTVFDVPLSKLSPLSESDLRKNLL